MSALTKIVTGAAGLAAVVGFASPAAAQYYPGYPYGGNQGVVGAIINGVLGGGQYGYGGYGYRQNSQLAVNQCARAVEARLNGYGGYGGYDQSYGGYNQNYGGYGYNQGYGAYTNGYAGGRVVQITRVEPRSSGTRVRGIASSGSGYGGYGYANAGGDLSFSCKVDYRGRITDIDIDPRYATNGYYRGY